MGFLHFSNDSHLLLYSTKYLDNDIIEVSNDIDLFFNISLFSLKQKVLNNTFFLSILLNLFNILFIYFKFFIGFFILMLSFNIYGLF